MTVVRRKRGMWWLLASMAAAALAASPRVVRFLRVDACLDHGGVWDYTGGGCRFDVASLPVPPSQPLSLLSIFLLLVAAACFLLAWWKQNSIQR